MLLAPAHFSMLMLCALAAFTDARSGRIPNLLTLPTLLIAPLAHLMIGEPGALIGALLGAGLCGLVPYLLFRRGAMGGGDVKLFAALGAVGGVEVGIAIQLYAFITACIGALFLLTWRGMLWSTLRSTVRLVIDAVRPAVRAEMQAEIRGTRTTLRMGVPIFLACGLVVGTRHFLGWT